MGESELREFENKLISTATGKGPVTQEQRKAILAAIKREYWLRGNLRFKCFPGGQTRLYDRIHEQPKRFPGVAEPIVALCHRRFGKSSLSGILCVERCLRQPGAEVHFGTDTKNHAREIIEGKLFETFKDMPEEIIYRTRQNNYWFRMKHWPKGQESKLVLEGLDYNLGGGMRGGSADLFIVDEAREIRNLEYVMKRVVTPMFKGRPNPTIMMCTTPPESMDHDFIRVYVERAMQTDSLITIPASQNPDWTEDDTKLMLQDYGSKENIGWRREIECELIVDTSKTIVPEWTPEIEKKCYVPEQERPKHYSPYVVLDMGWKDHSAALFAYYDFNIDKVIIVDEIFVNYTPTEDFAELLVQKIEKNFPLHVRENLRVLGDGNALNLADLNRAITRLSRDKYYVSEVDKYDRDAAINNMRSGIQAQKVLVEHHCEDTQYQLKNAHWNPKRTDFARTEKMGHCDLIACLVYLYKQIKWGENVCPTEEWGWKEGICRNPVAHKVATATEEAIGAIFGRNRFMGRRRKW